MNFNSKKIILFGLFSTLLMGFAVHAEDAKKGVYVLCRNGKQIRTLKTRIGADNVCRAMYNRDGAGEKPVGSGLNYDSCVGFLSKVRDNLEKGGWKCRDVKESETNLESPSSN